MNTKTLLPLTAAALFAVCAGSMLISGQSIAAGTQANAPAAATTHVVTLPTVTVRPEASDAAYYQANKIVDLAAITVRPETSDVAAFLAANSARIVDMPVVTVRPTVEDVRIVAVGVAALAQQLASR
jgi:hypothetical protein